jgi:hypothetical protein
MGDPPVTVLAILRDTGDTLLRAALLWLFAALGVAAVELGSGGGMSTASLLLSLLLFPVAVLAQAAQVRAVQLHHAGTGLAIGAFFTGTGQRSRAVLALLLSVAVLIAYAVLATGVIGLSG